jgi:hypothetical protein
LPHWPAISGLCCVCFWVSLFRLVPSAFFGASSPLGKIPFLTDQPCALQTERRENGPTQFSERVDLMVANRTDTRYPHQAPVHQLVTISVAYSCGRFVRGWPHRALKQAVAEAREIREEGEGTAHGPRSQRPFERNADRAQSGRQG